MKCRQLTSAALVVIARPGTFQPDAAGLAVADLAGHDIISVSGSGPLGDKAEAVLAGAQVAVTEIASVGTYYVAAALVRSGAGVAIVDQYTARSMVSQGLDRIPLVPEIRFGVQAAWLEDRPPSRLSLDFIKAVSRALSD